MERRIDEFRWHCSPHPCGHDVPGWPMFWRYSVVGKDHALSLLLSKSGGEFKLHRAFGVGDSEVTHHCDLLGADCYVSVESELRDGRAGPQVSLGLMFWTEHGVGGRREQPVSFWRALERRARALVLEAKRGRYLSTPCPRCKGTGKIEIKPKSQRGASR